MTDEIPPLPELVDDTVSPKFSLKGHDMGVWWSKNKELVKTGIAFCAFLYVFFRTDLSPELSAGAALVVAVAIKKGLDTIDFGVTEVKLK